MIGHCVALFVFLIAFFSVSLSVLDFSRCSFKTGLCGWSSTSKGLATDHEWQLGGSSHESKSYNIYGSDGHFVYAGRTRFSVLFPGSVSLESRLLQPSDNVCAVKFLYMCHDADGLRATVSLSSTEVLQHTAQLPSVFLNYGYGRWQEGLLPFYIKSSSVVKFELTMDLQAYGVLALDDIQFLSCSVCTFETGSCEWRNIRVHSWRLPTDWIRHSGPTHTQNTGPNADYTLGRGIGHYMYAEASRNYRHVAVLAGQEWSYSDNICGISFAYHMYGLRSGSLTVTIRAVDGIVVNSWHSSGDQGDRWHRGELTTEFWNSNTNCRRRLQVHIAATIGVYDTSDIAIDDVEYLPCVTREKCTFGLNFCSWRNSRQDQLQWHLEINEVDTTRNCLTVNLTEEVSDGEVASLVGPLVSGSDGLCAVRVEYEFTGWFSDTQLVIRIHHRATDKFTFVNLTASSRNTSSGVEREEVGLDGFPLVIALETAKRKGDQGRVIIHSLQYMPCQYASFEQMTSVIWHDSSPSSNTSRWQLQSAAERDHSYLGENKGSVIVTNGPELASLIADIQRLQVHTCSIRFWYLANVCYNLSVSARYHHAYSIPGVAMTHHWLTAPSVTWQRLERVFMASRTFDIDFDFSLHAVPVGDGLNAQLVIDDIELLPCPDFEACSFERDFCGWTAVVASTYDGTWIRWYGNLPSFSSGVMRDHTRHAVTGYFLYAHVSFQGAGESIAVLRGIPLLPDYHVCGVRLWYYIPPHADRLSGFATLSVVFVSAGGASAVVWSSKGSLHSLVGKWAVVEAGHQVMEEGHFQLVANVSNGRDRVQTATILVDDVMYIECENTNVFGLNLFNGSHMDTDFNMEADVILDLESVCPELAKVSVLSSSVYSSILNTVLLRGQSSSRNDQDNRLLLSSIATVRVLSTSLVKITSATTLLDVVNMTHTSALVEESDFPVAVVAGTIFTLLLFLIVLIVVILVAVGHRRKTAQVEMQDVVLSGPSTPSLYVREKPIQPAVENLYSGTDPTSTSYIMVHEEPIYAVPHSKSSTKQNENILYDTTSVKSASGRQDTCLRTRENILYQSFDELEDT